MNLTVDVSQALQALQSIKPTPELMADIGASVAEPVVRYQKAHAPRDTGNTADSVTYEITNVSFTHISVDVGPTTPYAVYLEYGTGIYAENGQGRQTPWKYQNRLGEWVTTEGMRAHPFIRPSVEDAGVLSEAQRQLDQTVYEFVQANWNKRSWKSKLTGLFKFGKK
jgi:HK97 gp10 family phage protein